MNLRFTWQAWRPLRKFAGQESGSTVGEHAVVLALLGAGLLLTVGAAGSMFPGQFAQVASHLAPTPEGPSAALPSTSAGPSSVQEPRTSLGGVVVRWSAPALAVLVVGAGVLWIALRPRRPATSATNQDEPPLAKATPEQTQARFIAKRQQILRALSHDMRRLLEVPLEVRQLMTDAVLTVPPAASVDRLVQMMSQQEVHHLLVCSDDRRLLGVISDRDVKGGAGRTAGDIMTPAPLTASPHAHIKPVVSMMLDRHVSSLPVVDDGRLVGILTTTDLLLAFQCTIQLLEAVIAAPLPAPGGHRLAARHAPDCEAVVSH